MSTEGKVPPVEHSRTQKNLRLETASEVHGLGWSQKSHVRTGYKAHMQTLQASYSSYRKEEKINRRKGRLKAGRMPTSYACWRPAADRCLILAPNIPTTPLHLTAMAEPPPPLPPYCTDHTKNPCCPSSPLPLIPAQATLLDHHYLFPPLIHLTLRSAL